MSRSPDITDYDKFHYDYSEYWSNRKYEHLSEQFALTKMLKGVSGNWFIDVGGSYGRHLNLYKDKYKNKIICDYSIRSLKKAQSTIQKMNSQNTFLVAANAYNLPFKAGVFDGIFLIRVIHHIEDVPKLFKEISRVCSRSGLFFLEYANKINIKAIIRALFKLNPFFIFNLSPLKHESKGYCEGSSKNIEGIMFNFHPQWIKTLLVSHEFRTLFKTSISFLRSPFLKRFMSLKLMFTLEKFLQKTLGWTNIPPSILLKLQKTKGTNKKYVTIENVLACPKCKSDLHFSKQAVKCKRCGLSFPYTKGIYDLRYPKLPG